MTLIEPTGAKKRIESTSEVVGILQNNDCDYWSNGSGSLAIELDIENKSHSLALTKKKDLGFMIHHFFDVEQFVIINSEDYSNTTVINVGGEPWEVPEAFFINEKLAIEAIVTFIDTGKFTGVKLVDFHTQSWENKILV